VRADPGDGALDLDEIGARRAAARVGHDGGEHLGDLAGFVLRAAGAFDDHAVLEPHLVAGEEAEEALGRHFGKIVTLDPERRAEAEAAFAQLGPLRMRRRVAGFAGCRPEDLAPVRQRELERIDHRHRARRLAFQVVAQRDVQAGVFGPATGLAGAGALAHQADRLGRVAAPAQADDGGHARVVPAVDDSLVDQGLELALAGDDVGDVQPRELVLVRARLRQQAERAQRVEQPVVEGPLVLELQRADAVRDLLERILDRVRVGVHRVDAPAAAGVVVLGVLDAVDGRVAQVDVGRGHVDLGAQHHRAVGVLAVAHLAKARQVLGRRALAERAVRARRGEIAAVGAHLLGALLVDVGQPRADQRLGGAVHEVEIVAGVVEVGYAVHLPVEAQPLHRVEDGVDVLLLLLLRVGVVEAHVADAAVFRREAEVQRDALGVADVQVAVGLGREAGADARRVERPRGVVGRIAGRAGEVPLRVAALLEVALDDLAQEVAGVRGFGAVVGGRGTHAAILSTRPAAPPSCGGAGRNMSLPCAVNEAPPAGRCRRQVRKACAPPKEKDA